MLKLSGTGMIGGASLVAMSLMLAPALAAPGQAAKAKKARPSQSLSIGSIGNFTPAVADPRLAAAFARRDFQTETLRFTPSSPARDRKAIRVAVRARASTPSEAIRSANETGAPGVTAITPTAYNLGASVGWKRFALSTDVAKVQGGVVPGGREAAQVGVSYLGKKFTGRVAVGAERTNGTLARVVAPEDSYSLDVGGSYTIARNIDVTGGVRYKIQRERLEPLTDERRDSQAVYIGTAFRF
jgi:hypothetical protein